MHDVTHLLRQVRSHRLAVLHSFAWPDAPQCVAYALTEVGEYTDALLREQRAGDNRAAQRERDALLEWGQCGYMLASALLLMSADVERAASEVAAVQVGLPDRVGPAQVIAAMVDALDVFYSGEQTSDAFWEATAQAFAAWLIASEAIVSPLAALRLAEQSIDERVTYHKPTGG